MKKKGIAKTLYSLFFGASIFLAVFVLLEFRESYFAVAASAVVFLIAGYLFFDCLEKGKNQNDGLQEQLNQMLEVQKALYVATKKNGEQVQNFMKQSAANADEMRMLLGMLSDKLEGQMTEIKRGSELQVNAMKLVAKYNKENARQLEVNANENTERMIEGIKNLSTLIKDDVADSVDNMIKEVEDRYQNISDVMLTNTVTLSERIESVIGNIQNWAEPEAEPELMLDELPLPEVEAEPELVLDELPLPEVEAEPELVLDELPLPEVEAEPELVLDELPLPEVEAEPELVLDELPLPEVEAEPELVLDELPLPEVEAEPEPEPTPAPVLSADPNHAMTPDEIAALIASMN